MKLHILSDLHMEFGSFELPKNDADLLILAGDTHTKLSGVKWLIEIGYNKPVLYILGNHEYYGAKLPRLVEKLRTLAEGSRIHILENNSFKIDGYRFYGATLWTDFDLLGNPDDARIEAGQTMNDYKRIRKNPEYRKLRPIDTRAVHARTIAGLNDFFATGNPERSVVITHHAPSSRSLPERRRNQTISAAYASNLDEKVQQWQPKLWIHGHIHHSQDYQIGTTRIISNPRAYIDEPNPNFNPNLVIDLDENKNPTTP